MAIQTQAQYLHRLSEIIDSNKTVVKLVVLQPKVIIKIIGGNGFIKELLSLLSTIENKALFEKNNE